MVPRDKMAILGINCLIFLISTGSFVKCMIYESEAGTWETTRNTCQLLNSSILCAGDPDTCNLKNDVTISTGQFWIGAYVHATTITFYTAAKNNVVDDPRSMYAQVQKPSAAEKRLKLQEDDNKPNQEVSRHENKDGLLYMDVDFSDTPKHSAQPLSIPKSDCEYADVEHT